jgi:hypothetical protein
VYILGAAVLEGAFVAGVASLDAEADALVVTKWIGGHSGTGGGRLRSGGHDDLRLVKACM